MPEVQIQEPILALSHAAELEADFQKTFEALAAVGVPINLVTMCASCQSPRCSLYMCIPDSLLGAICPYAAATGCCGSCFPLSPSGCHACRDAYDELQRMSRAVSQPALSRCAGMTTLVWRTPGSSSCLSRSALLLCSGPSGLECTEISCGIRPPVYQVHALCSWLNLP